VAGSIRTRDAIVCRSRREPGYREKAACAFGGPRVRIRLPPAGSQQRTVCCRQGSNADGASARRGQAATDSR